MDIQQLRKKRLREVIGRWKNAAAFCRETSIDSSYLSQVLNNHRPFGEKSARNMEELIGLPRMYLDLDESPNVTRSVQFARMLPLIAWVSASEYCESPDNFEPGDAEDWIIDPFKHGPSAYCLRVSGPSMWPDYRDGEIIVVDPEIEAKHGKDVVVRTPDEDHTFKRLQITEDGTFLLALNPEWKKRYISIPEGSIMCGVVVGSLMYR